jgi:hypothetical protein
MVPRLQSSAYDVRCTRHTRGIVMHRDSCQLALVSLLAASLVAAGCHRSSPSHPPSENIADAPPVDPGGSDDSGSVGGGDDEGGGGGGTGGSDDPQAPAPEPATLLLLGGGIAGVALLRRRRRTVSASARAS